MPSSRFPSTVAIVSVALLALGALATVRAQPEDDNETDPPGIEAEGTGFFALGVHAVNLAPLNDQLSGAGYPTFATEMLSFGGGGHGVVAGRILLGGTGHGVVSPSKGYQGREVGVGGGYGLATLGYLFRPSPKLRVFPQLGVGGGGLQLEIGSAGAEQFDDVLQNPNRSATLQQGSVLLRVGAGLEYLFGPTHDGGQFRLGLRVGYLLSPYDTDWNLDEHTLSGGPDASLGGPFFQLTIGGGGTEDREEDEPHDRK